MTENLQTALWSVIGTAEWWTCYTILCTCGAVLLFSSLLRAVDHDALFYARLVLLSGLVAGGFGFVKLNSAFQPLSGGLFAVGSTYFAFLIETNWCHRQGTFWQKMGQVWHQAWHKKEQEKTLR
jgi:hypothetical protein